jgi:hypothetical protein
MDKKKKKVKLQYKEERKKKYEGTNTFGSLSQKYYQGQEQSSEDAEAFTQNDSEMQLIIKKLNKKAIETKIKGFQELINKMATLNKAQMGELAAYYRHIFKNTIEYEHERKIRELLFIALQPMIPFLIPFLKDMFPYWYISFYDLPEVANKAQELYRTIAPHNFYQSVCEEFLTFVENKLSTDYNQMKIELGSLDEQLKVEIYERTLSTSLYALANSFSLHLGNEYLELVSKKLNLDDPNSMIFTYIGPKSKGKVKTAALECISTLLKEYPPQKFEVHLGDISSTVINSINEPNMQYQQTLWSKIMLNIIIGYEKVWEAVNIKKLFLNRLYQCLRRGAYGAAISLYSNLMQILSKFTFLKFEDKQLDRE